MILVLVVNGMVAADVTMEVYGFTLKIHRAFQLLSRCENVLRR